MTCGKTATNKWKEFRSNASFQVVHACKNNTLRSLGNRSSVDIMFHNNYPMTIVSVRRRRAAFTRDKDEGVRRSCAGSGQNRMGGHENGTRDGRALEEGGRRFALRGWLPRSLSFSLPSLRTHERTHARLHARIHAHSRWGRSATFLLAHLATSVGDASAPWYSPPFVLLRCSSRAECSCNENHANMEWTRVDITEGISPTKSARTPGYLPSPAVITRLCA